MRGSSGSLCIWQYAEVLELPRTVSARESGKYSKDRNGGPLRGFRIFNAYRDRVANPLAPAGSPVREGRAVRPPVALTA